MDTRFKHHDSLRLFLDVAQFPSYTEAADALGMTKGAISYQIKTLEDQLGCNLFVRIPRGVSLTMQGRQLLSACSAQYHEIETHLATLKAPLPPTLTVGMSSYFASRWLSSRLMTFMQDYPDIQLRIQPMTQLFNLERQEVDLAIRWGNGLWDDVEIIPFMPMPAWPVGNREAADKVRNLGLKRAFSEFTLLRDHDGSNAWTTWLQAAGLPDQTRKDTLIIPDPNVRVQAVIDGQGISLNDELVMREVKDGQLVRLSEIELSNYGYFLAIPGSSTRNVSVEAFVRWLLWY